MKSKISTIFLAAFLALSVRVFADDTTSRLGLTVPSIGSSGYAPKINADLVKIDSGTAVLAQANNFTGTNTFTGTVNLNGTLSLLNPLSTTYGGTGQNWSAVTIGRIPYFSGTGAMTTLSTGTSGWLLSTNGAAAPSWVNPSGLSVSYAATAGNAATVTNGVYTNGSYSNPSWITGLAGSKITGYVSSSTYADTAGAAGSVTNGVYTTGSYADPTWLTSLAGSKITGYVSSATYATGAGNAATVTNGVYTTGSYADPSWLTSLLASKITQPFSLLSATTSVTSPSFIGQGPGDSSIDLYTNGFGTAGFYATSHLGRGSVEVRNNSGTNTIMLSGQSGTASAYIVSASSYQTTGASAAGYVMTDVAGDGHLTMQPPTGGGGGSSIYPATATASFPYGLGTSYIQPVATQTDFVVSGSTIAKMNANGFTLGDDEGYVLDRFSDFGYTVPRYWTEVDSNGALWQSVSDNTASFYADEGFTGRSLIYRNVPGIRSMTVTAFEQSDVDAYSLTKACVDVPTVASEEAGCITAKFYFPSTGTDPDVGGDCDGQYKLLQLYDGTSNVGYACGDHPGAYAPHTIKVAAENGALTADVDNGTWSVSSTTALSTFAYGAIGGRQMTEYAGFGFQNATFGTDRDYMKFSASTIQSNNVMKVRSHSPTWTIVGTEVGPFAGLVGSSVAFTVADTEITRTFVDLSALNISYINGSNFAFDDNTYVHEGSVLRQGAYTATINTRLLNGYWQVSDPTGFTTGAATISDFTDPDNATADEVASTISGAMTNSVFLLPILDGYVSWTNDGYDRVQGVGSLLTISVGEGTANSILGFSPMDQMPKASIQVADDPKTGFVMSKPNPSSYDGITGIVGGYPWLNVTPGGGTTLISPQQITLDAEIVAMGPAGNEVFSAFYGLENGQIGVTLGGNPSPGAVGQASVAINGQGVLAYDSGTGLNGVQWGTIGNGNGARSYVDFYNSSYLSNKHRFIVASGAGNGVIISTGDLTNPYYQTPGALLDIRGGVVIGEPTGGDQGYGSINVSSGIFKNGTAFTNPDYALEHWATGQIKQFKLNPGAAGYRGRLDLDGLEKFMRKHHELPRVGQAREAFDRMDVLLEKVEEAYTYIIDLNKRIRVLEKKLKKAEGKNGRRRPKTTR
jgi:hypothetical protein